MQAGAERSDMTYNIGDKAIIISDECRLPRGSEVDITGYSKSERQYIVTNRYSDYACWVRESDIAPREDTPFKRA